MSVLATKSGRPADVAEAAGFGQNVVCVFVYRGSDLLKDDK
jgi:hypothetical protein